MILTAKNFPPARRFSGLISSHPEGHSGSSRDPRGAGLIRAADLFCGAGGTSTGLVEAAEESGRRINLTAVNHWPRAIETHVANHPSQRHLCANIDEVNPRDLFAPDSLDLLWASPECIFHSVARGGRPINEQGRATAFCVSRWAEALRPKVILVENVKEFVNWGPIGVDGKRQKSRTGETFRAWVALMESLGYRVEWRVLCAADYGDPTTRRRLFVYMVRGRRKIVWPEPTHGPAESEGADLFDTRKPWVAAREIIDWTLPGKSIFSRKKPLAGKTLDRIKAGLSKFGLHPFVVAWDNQSATTGEWSQDAPLGTVTTKARHGVVQPFLVSTAHGIDARSGFLSRIKGLEETFGTVTGCGDWALAQPFILPQQRGGAPVHDVASPLSTVATAGAHALAQPYLIKFYGNEQEAHSIAEPLGTVTTKDRFGLCRPTVEIQGERYVLDVLFRMLTPKELAAAQGFRADYKFTGNISEVVKQIGNAVPRNLAKALAKSAIKVL